MSSTKSLCFQVLVITYVVIFQPHLRMVCIYRSLFVMQELARHTISFYIEAIY
jgi:hypothetical protein